MQPVVRLDDLSVSYGSVRALADVNVEIAAGTTGLLGPNGAGKTTLLKVLLGFLRPQGASVDVAGHDPSTRAGRLGLRREVGYMPEGSCLLPQMNAVETVATLGRISGMDGPDAMARAHEVLDYVGLDEARYRDVATYSTGMQQRVKLAQALVHDPPILLLDEPTNGLDPKGRIRMLDLVSTLATEHGKSVLLCSHLLPDVERTCDHVVVLHQGHVRAQGTIADMTRGDGNWLKLELTDPAQADTLSDAARAAGMELENPGEGLRVRLPAGIRDADPLFRVALDVGVTIAAVEPTTRSLEEVFMQLLDEEPAR